NMERLLKKFETAKKLVPAPVISKGKHAADYGVVYIGSTSEPMREAIAALEAQGLHVDTLRVRGFPFSDEVFRFIETHPYSFVVEQNRDAQLKTMLMVEGQIDPARLISVLH